MKKITTNHGVAPWKIDHPIERWLSRYADKSDFGKKLYVHFYKLFDKYLNYFEINL